MKRTMKRLGLSVAGLSIMLAACATGPKPAVVTPATTPPAPAINPFVDARIYVNPDYAKTVEGLAATHPGEAELIKKMATIPTAIWLSSIADTKDIPRYLDGALQQQKAGGHPVVTVFVLYDLPNRDCNAEASAGELPATPAGEARYQREYVDVVAAAFAAHPDQRIAVIIEPDSIANLVTNLENPKCQAAEGIYKLGIAYAISKLSQPNVFLYLDAAHAGWLGWPRNLAEERAAVQGDPHDGGRRRPDPRLRDRRVELRPGEGSDQPQARSEGGRQRRARLRRRLSPRSWPPPASPARGS